MTKKMIVPVLIICTLLTGAGLGTYAWFTSQKVSGNNTIRSGKLEVELGGQAAENTSFTIGGLVQPGDIVTVDGSGAAGPAVVEVTNKGDFDIAAFCGFEVDSVGEDAKKLQNEIYFSKLKFEFPVGNSLTDTWKQSEVIVDDTGAVVESYNNLKDGDGHISLSNWMSANYPSLGLITGKRSVGLKPNNKFKITFELKMDEDAVDEYQNCSLTGRFKALTTQTKEDAIKNLLNDSNLNYQTISEKITEDIQDQIQ